MSNTRIYCDNCGQVVEEGSKFCSNCGATITERMEEAVYSPPSTTGHISSTSSTSYNKSNNYQTSHINHPHTSLQVIDPDTIHQQIIKNL